MPPTGRDASQCDYIRTREIAILWDARESLTVVRRAATQGDDIAPDRICEIRHIATCNPDNIEGVLAKALARDEEMQSGIRTPCKCIGC